MEKYKYKGKIYCEEDLSEEMENYAGDLFDLYWELKEAGEAHEKTFYYSKEPESSDDVYDSPEELIEAEFSELEVR